MINPNGPYPGRQLFLGLTSEQKPCFAYLVTGRSPASRERMAISIENGIGIGPIGTVEYDPLRHYSAVKYDIQSGILVVTNGIQTEAIFETYRLIFNAGNHASKDFMEKILDGAGAEPDPPLNTARIAGVITGNPEGTPVFIIGIKAYGHPAKAWKIEPEPGTISGISTYRGNMEKPEAPDIAGYPSQIEFSDHTSQNIVSFLFDISEASNKGADIRVCAVGGVRSDKRWDIAIKNVLTA